MKSLRKVNYKQLLARHKELVDIFAVEIDYIAFNNTFYVSKETSKIAKSRIIDIRYFDSVKIINKDRMVTVDKFTSPHISVKLTESARKEIADKIFGGTLADEYPLSLTYLYIPDALASFFQSFFLD